MFTGYGTFNLLRTFFVWTEKGIFYDMFGQKKVDWTEKKATRPSGEEFQKKKMAHLYHDTPETRIRWNRKSRARMMT